MSSKKKIALVTGANRGIGVETARQLGQNSVAVVVGARTREAAEDTAAKLKAEGVEAYPIQLDVTKEADRKATAQYLAREFGKLDILINNAGIGVFDNKTIETSEEVLRSTFET